MQPKNSKYYRDSSKNATEEQQILQRQQSIVRRFDIRLDISVAIFIDLN